VDAKFVSKFCDRFVWVTNSKRDQKIIYSVNTPAVLLKQMKFDGVDHAFNPLKSLDKILDVENPTAPKGNGKFQDSCRV